MIIVSDLGVFMELVLYFCCFSHCLVSFRRALLEDCMRILFYRDCRALNRIQIAKTTAEGTAVSDPYTVREGASGYTISFVYFPKPFCFDHCLGVP